MSRVKVSRGERGDLAGADAAVRALSARGYVQGRRWLRLAWLPIPVLLITMAVFWAADLRTAHESPHLLLALNFVFSTMASLFVAYLISRSFLVRGTPELLLAGCGVILWGAAGSALGIATALSAAGTSPADINNVVTIHNLCIWISALCQLAAAVASLRSRRPIRAADSWLATAYSVALGVIGLVLLATLSHWTPAFFVQDQGGTPLRQFVLGSAIIMLVLAAFILGPVGRSSSSSFPYWYTRALFLIAVGLFGILIERVHAGALSWTGRAAQLLGGAYLLVAAVASVRETRAWGIPLETALRESDEGFRRLVEQTKDYAIFMLDPEGRVVSWNSGAQTIKGYTEAEIIGRHISCFYVPEDMECGKPEWLLKTAGECGVAEDQGWRVRKDGTRFWAEVVLSRLSDDSGRIRGFSKVTRDVTERKQAEAQASTAQAQLEGVFQAVEDGIVVFDMAGQVVLVNEAHARMLGYAGADAMHKDMSYFAENFELRELDGEILPVEEWPVSKALRGETFANWELQARRTDTGQNWFFSDSGAPVRDAQGRQILAVVTTSDITKRKQAEARLNADISALTQMHALSGRVLEAVGLQPLLQEVMNAAVTIMEADRGTLQMLEGDSLRIVAHHGHRQPFLDFFACAESRASVCGEAMARSERVVVQDIESSPLFAGTPSLPVLREAGVRSVQSTPLVSRTGMLLGILTTQWGVPYEPSEHDLWRIDLLARQAADLIEHAKVEEALRQSERRKREQAAELGTVLDAVPVPVIIVHDPDSRHMTGNRATDELLRHPSGAEVSLSAPSPVKPGHFRAFKDGRELRLDELPAQRAARGEHVRDFEFRLVFDDGTIRDLLAYGTPLMDEQGRPRGAVHALVDITERKRAEEALRNSERLYSAIGESIDYGVWICAPDGRNTYASASFLRLVGMTQQQCSDFGWRDVLHPEDAERTIAAWKECVQTGGNWDIEHRFRGADGQWHPILARGVPVRDDQGRITCWAGINLDIGRFKQAEQALLRSEKLASAGRVAATIAHEINNPLAAVTNVLYLAKGNPDLPASAREYLEMADAELKRVAHITRQSLGFYRESNAPSLSSVNAMLESAVDLLKSKIEAKQARIEKQWAEDVEVTAIAGELRQVFSNLLANGLDAIDEQGTITLRVSTGNALKHGGRCVRVTVADNGKGIGASLRSNLFEPFFTTKGTVGTGLGLWVSKQIIDKHGGTIRMRSSTYGARRGTVFSVVLPAEPGLRSQSASS
jgi:PAS domain S-box-containing protein